MNKPTRGNTGLIRALAEVNARHINVSIPSRNNTQLRIFNNFINLAAQKIDDIFNGLNDLHLGETIKFIDEEIDSHVVDELSNTITLFGENQNDYVLSATYKDVEFKINVTTLDDNVIMLSETYLLISCVKYFYGSKNQDLKEWNNQQLDDLLRYLKTLINIIDNLLETMMYYQIQIFRWKTDSGAKSTAPKSLINTYQLLQQPMLGVADDYINQSCKSYRYFGREFSFHAANLTKGIVGLHDELKSFANDYFKSTKSSTEITGEHY